MNKPNSLKSKLRNRQLTIGSWITLGHSSIAEIMAKAGFDWLTVDMEHSAITLHEAQQLIQVIDLSGCVPLVRVGANDANLIKRVMDAGAHGVIVPMINTKEDAEQAVGAVKYPPQGFRGVGLARAQSYGTNFEGYRKWNGLYRMWYCYAIGNSGYRIGYGESKFANINWERKDQEVGIDVSESGWDSEMVCYPFVFSHKGQIIMLYCGNGYGKTGFGYAILEEGIR